MTVEDVVNRVLREFKRYTGDGMAGEPANAPLPVGDPASGPHSPKKSELRAALLASAEASSEDATRAETARGAAETAAASVTTGLPRVTVVATANLNLASPGASIDGKTMEAGDSFLATGQSDASANGPYMWNGAASAATRAPFADTYDKIAGQYFSVMEGSSNSDALWRCTSDFGGTLGVTDLDFDRFTSGGAEGGISSALLALHVSEFTEAAVFLGDSGNRVADAWLTGGYIDEASSTGADFSEPGVIKTASSDSGTVASNAGTGNNDGWANNTVVVAIAAAQVALTGYGTVEVTFHAGETEGLQITNAYIGHAAASGDAFDFAAVPVQLLFSGNVNAAIGINGTAVGTAVFTIAAGQNLLIAYQVGASGAADGVSYATETGWSSYWKAATGETANVNKSGYSFVGNAMGISEVAMTALPVEMAAYVGPFDVSVGPETMTGLLRVVEIDVATINVDYTLRASRDGKTTWQDVELVEMFTSPSPASGTLIVSGIEADVSSQTDAGELWFEIATHNGKRVEFHGGVFDWRGGEPP